MLRFVMAAMLVSCGAPATAIATLSPAPTATRSATIATAPSSATARSSPTPEPTGLPTCMASQLQAVAAGVMATDFFAGAVFIANRGTSPCTLRGNPEVLLLASGGSPLDVRSASVTAGAPRLVVVPVTQFQQDPAGLVGIGASAPLRWENYCDDVLPMTFRVTLPEGGGVLEGTFVDLPGRPVSTFGTARCDDASGPSTLAVYPFQEPVQ